MKNGDIVKIFPGLVKTAVVPKSDTAAGKQRRKGAEGLTFAPMEDPFGNPGSVGKCWLDPDMIYPALHRPNCGRMALGLPYDAVDASIYMLKGPSDGYSESNPPKVSDNLFEYNFFTEDGAKEMVMNYHRGVVNPGRVYWRYLGDDDFVTFNAHKNALADNFKYMGISQNYEYFTGGDPFYILNPGVYTVLLVVQMPAETLYAWFDYTIYHGEVGIKNPTREEINKLIDMGLRQAMEDINLYDITGRHRGSYKKGDIVPFEILPVGLIIAIDGKKSQKILNTK